jgi:hypothetical protein
MYINDVGTSEYLSRKLKLRLVRNITKDGGGCIFI